MPSREAPLLPTRRRLVRTAAALFLVAALPALAEAQDAPAAGIAPTTPDATPTHLVVRAVSNDAKVIGTNVGGVRITVRDAATGEVLAEGVQEGGTGSTPAIMGPRERGATVFDHEGTASFTATLALTEPTLVTVEAEGPLGTPHAVRTAGASLLMLPGVDIVGEGLALVLHGFTVKLAGATAGDGPFHAHAIPVRADVTMLCGCPIESGGMWDADRITVTASLLQDGRVVASERLPWAGETNIFEGDLVPPGEGSYELRVTAVDAERANTGMVTREIVVGPS